MHRHRSLILVIVVLIAAVVIARQVQAPTSPSQSDGPIAAGPGLVLDVLDGDTARIRMAGYEGSVRIVGIDTPEIVVEKVRASKDKSFGYNAFSDEYEDLVAAGVIDPTKVTRTALQNAASIASLLLTTEAVIVEKKEKEAPAPAAPGGGMGGMY